jgi:hypothetical protein
MLGRRHLGPLALSILAGIAAGCSVAHASETGVSSELEARTAAKYTCSETTTYDGTTILDQGTLTIDTKTSWMTMTRKRSVNGTVKGTGSAQGYAITSSGNLNNGFADALNLTTHLLGEVGLVTALDGSNPRMLVPGGTYVKCTAD